jgi:hypothetical protein
MEPHRLKIMHSGEIYLDQKKIELAALRTALAAAKKKQRPVYLYRERTDENTPMTTLALAMIDEIGVEVESGLSAPAEWGELTDFQLYVMPGQFKLAFQEGLLQVGLASNGKKTPSVHEIEPDARVIETLEYHISACRIIETPEHEPDRAFDDRHRSKPSLHLLIVHNSEQTWQSFYPISEVPPNVKSLLENCKTLGLDLLKAKS